MRIGVGPSLFVLLALTLTAREKTDVIILVNGDTLTGEIKRLDSGVLYVALDYVDGTIAVQWSKVARLETKQLFIVRTQDGTLHTGTLSGAPVTAGGPVVVRVTGDQQRAVQLERSSIVNLSETSPRFFERFSGELDAGATESNGSDSVQYNLAAEVAYRRERWGLLTNINSNLSSSSGSDAASRNQARFIGYHFLGRGEWFYGGVGNVLQSSVQKLDIMGGAGAGLGRYLKNTNRMRLWVLGGVVMQTAQYSAEISPSSQKLAAGLLMANLSVFKFKRTNLDISASLFPAFSNPDRGRFYFDTNASYYIKIIGNLSWTFSFYGNWDSRPPEHSQGSDYGSSSGLSWTFGGR